MFRVETHLIAVILFLIPAVSSAEVTYPDVEIDKTYLKKVVSVLSEKIGPRNFDQFAGLEKAAKFIRSEFESQGYDVIRQRYTVYGENNAAENIIVRVGPKNAERLVIGAHYDSFSEQPGADDNASGVAGLLELARLLKNYPGILNRKVELVAFTLEEPPFFRTELMGSYIHAKSLADANAKVYGMIALEMIGYYSGQKDTQKYPLSLMKLFYPDTGNFIAVVSNYSSSSLKSDVSKYMSKSGVAVETLSAPALLVGIDFSDHLNYWNFDYDAIMVTDTAFYRNKNYHSVGDKMDTLNFDLMAEVVRGIFNTVIHVAGNSGMKK